jgi:hypothetical protein
MVANVSIPASFFFAAGAQILGIVSVDTIGPDSMS